MTEKLLLTSIGKEQTEKDKTKIDLKNCYPATCIHYIIKGQGYFNGRLLSVGDGFVCFKNDSVRYWPNPKDPWEYVWICVDGTEVTPQTCLCNNETHCFRFMCNEHFFRTVSFLIQSRAEYAHHTQNNNNLFDAACANLLISLHMKNEEEAAKISRRKQHVKLAKKYILSNYHNRISMEDLAKSLFLSKAYLRNIFVEIEGMSPQEFLMQTRITRAQELIKTTNLSVGQIAEAVGYQDCIQFYKMFKKRTGMSPSAYRNG